MKIEAAPVAINMMPAQKSLLVPNAIFIDYSVSELGNSRARDYLGITEMPYAALTPFRAAARNPRCPSRLFGMTTRPPRNGLVSRAGPRPALHALRCFYSALMLASFMTFPHFVV